MCAGLGIRQRYSQLHKPQANGRAERAGKKIIDRLRKMHVEEGVSWVEGLPRALWLHHDMLGDFGLTPYQIMFGRDRGVPGLPYTPERECESAAQFFQRMERIDTMIAEKLNKQHEMEMAARNSKRKSRKPFKEGDQVWLMRPPSLSTAAKLQGRWRGPMKVVQRRGESNYQVVDSQGRFHDAHMDQLCPFVRDEWDDVGGFTIFEMEEKPHVGEIMGHRVNEKGEDEFLVQWVDQDPSEAVWMGRLDMVQEGMDIPSLEWCQSRGWYPVNVEPSGESS